MRNLWALIVLLTCLATAQEWNPWAGEPEGVVDRMREMEERADIELFGELEPDERAEMNTYWASHLRRGPMDALERAQHNVAELQLRQKNYPAALAALTKLHAQARTPELRDVTLFNTAEIYRRCLHDNAKALERYARVTGPWRHRARSTALALLERAQQADQAAVLVEKFIKESQEKGETLALLQRLGRLYRDSGRNAEAIAVFERITREFTRKDLEAMREEASASVRRAGEQMIAMMREERGEEVERIERQLHERARHLRYAHRWDEFQVFQAEIEKVFQRVREFEEIRERLEEEEEREDERREREHDDDDPPRAGEL